MLKAGDKVTIKSNLKEVEKECTSGVTAEMLQYQGMKAEIRYVQGEKGKHWFLLDIDNGMWCWDSEMFEPVERSKTYSERIEDMIEHCKDMLLTKHTEYATEDDFHNFNVAASLQNVTPQQALVGMMTKHVVSVCDLVNDHAEGREIPLDKWKEKIGDNVNYLLILWAMVNMRGCE